MTILKSKLQTAITEVKLYLHNNTLGEKQTVIFPFFTFYLN